MLKVIAKKLDVTKRKVSREWQHYREKKYKLLHRKKRKLSKEEKKQVLTSEIDLTRQKISKHYVEYREVKKGIIYKSPYKGFRFLKTMRGSMYKPAGYEEAEYFKFHDSYQKIYKAKKGFDTDNLDLAVEKIIYEKNVKGILLVFEIHNVDEDTTSIVSNFINREEFELLEEREETIYEYVLGRFQGYGNYKLKFIYMRIIYAKTK